MHIALFFWDRLPVPEYGGTQRMVVALARGLAAAGHRVTLVAGRGSEVPDATRHLVRRHRCPPHDELGDDGGDEAGDDESGPAGELGDEHDGGQRHPVAGAEERGHAHDGKQGGRLDFEGAAHGASDECSLDDEGDEQPAGAAPADDGNGAGDAQRP